MDRPLVYCGGPLASLDVNPAEAIEHGPDHHLDLLLIGHVARHGQDLCALPREISAGALQLLGIAGADGQPDPLVCQLAPDRQA